MLFIILYGCAYKVTDNLFLDSCLHSSFRLYFALQYAKFLLYIYSGVSIWRFSDRTNFNMQKALQTPTDVTGQYLNTPARFGGFSSGSCKTLSL
jgi:hypothetical protein